MGTGTLRTLHTRWIVCVAVAGLVTLADYRLFRFTIDRAREGAAIVEFAAHQPALLRKARSLAAALESRGAGPGDHIRRDLEASVDELARNHELLRDAAQDAGPESELHDLYLGPRSQLDGRLARFTADLRRSLEGHAPVLSESGGPDDLAAMLERAERLHASAADRNVRALERVDRMLLAADLTILGLMALLVFRPMVTRVRDQLTKLADSNDELRARALELERARVLAVEHAADARRQREAAEHTRQEASEQTRELETMLYVISHDLREPLRSIEQFSQVVSERYTDKLDDRGADLLARTMRAAQRMRLLLEDLLELSRARRLRPPDEATGGADIVAEALERLSGRIEETGAKVRVARDLPTVRADRTWAVHAVYNLLANALKFTRGGEPPEVEILGYREEHVASGFIVRDHGPGVAPEHAQRIFRLFQRAVGRDVEGTGAGLAIVTAIAERHGGRAWVQPHGEGGSEFIVTFADTRSDVRMRA